jgi:chromosome segregation ATPase
MLKGFLDKYVLADEAGAAAQPPAATKPATQAFGAAPSTVQPSGNEFVTALRNAIKARQTAYTALLGAADKLAGIIPDANTRLKAAFATVQGEGRGLKEVLGAIDIHVSDLEGQRMQFSAALQKQKDAAIGTLQRELDGLKPANDSAQQQIQSMSEQIAQLQALMQTNQQRATTLQGEIASQTTNFTISEQSFSAALTLVKSELEGQKTAVMSVLS